MNKDNKDQDNFFGLVEKAKTVQLTDKERAHVFAAVSSYVKKNPLSEPGAGVMPGAVKSPFLSKDFWPVISYWRIHSARSLVAVIVLVVIVVGSGTSFAAQGTLPGDLLYPVRVNFNEEVKALFLSDKSRTTYEIERLKSRVNEAKVLAGQDRLSTKVRDEVVERVSGHLAVVKERVEDLASRGDLKMAFEISNDLESSLTASEIEVSETQPDSDISTDEAKSINEIIKGPRIASSIVREKAEDKILSLDDDQESVKAIAVAKRESVRSALKLIKEGSTSVSLSSISSESEEKTGLVEQADDLIDVGDEALSMGNYEKAFAVFKEADEAVQAFQIEKELDITDSFESELNQIIIDLEKIDAQ